MTNINEKVLVDAGLSKEQSLIYLHLLEYGMSNAKVIASKTNTGRTLTYKVLDQLVSMELAEKRENIGKIALFFPGHPHKLRNFVDKRRNEALEASNNLNHVFGSLSSSYNLLFGKPNVQYYEGVDGLMTIYQGILEVSQNIMVISAPIQEGRKDVLHLIKEQIEKQVIQKIQTKAITPLNGQVIATPISHDEEFLITRKQIPAEKLNIPAQIILYGDKVAITNFKDSMISIVIDSKYIRETFEKMFDYIWNHG